MSDIAISPEIQRLTLPNGVRAARTISVYRPDDHTASVQAEDLDLLDAPDPSTLIIATYVTTREFDTNHPRMMVDCSVVSTPETVVLAGILNTKRFPGSDLAQDAKHNRQYDLITRIRPLSEINTVGGVQDLRQRRSALKTFWAAHMLGRVDLSHREPRESATKALRGYQLQMNDETNRHPVLLLARTVLQEQVVADRTLTG